ncbi:MAG TPA: hypothetical protein VNR38_03470 [Ureibacillus sp.]|nr:hypothetical protein [Ureibacillus sp.]
MMFKVYSRKTISTILAGSLIFSLGTVIVSAAPNSNNSVTTGRTEQNVETGVITADKVPTLAHYATDVTLTGKIVIDGPKLVLLVNGQDVSNKATLTKVADKTWTYQYKTTVGDQTGDVSFDIDAYTVYANGKPAGQVHTNARSVTQSVHVPFIEFYDYTNLQFTEYDRNTNIFKFSYNLVNVWDDGDREVVSSPVDASVLGSEEYQDKDKGIAIKPPVVVRSFNTVNGHFSNYNRTDNTYDLSFDLISNLSNGDQLVDTISETNVDASTDYGYTASHEGLFPYSQVFIFTPPIVLKDFVFSNESPEWIYNEENKTYSVNLVIIKTMSNGDTVNETITRDGLTPGSTVVVSETVEDLTKSTTLTVPASPVANIPSSVTGTVDLSTIKYEWTGNNGNGGNVKATYTIIFTINGEAFKVKENYTFNHGTGYKDQETTYIANYYGTNVNVNYKLPYKEPSSKDDNTSNNNGN